MFEQGYRRRLEADLTRWQADGTIAPATVDAIRGSLGPMPKGVNVATVVAMVGGLLIAAAFLAFVAANWLVIPRPARFAILLAGIAGAYGLGAVLAQQRRTHLADMSVVVGSIIFGAAIALVGQMYHIAGDFAAGLMLWAIGALIAAVLTGSRGALAVALAAACVWSGMRAIEFSDVPHIPFVMFWAVAAGLALVWASPVARHLVSVAAIAWWIMTAIGMNVHAFSGNPEFIFAAGACLALGAGLAAQARGPQSGRAFGATLATYAAFALAIVLSFIVADVFNHSRPAPAGWVIGCGLAGAALAAAATIMSRRAAAALTTAAIVLALVAANDGFGEWLSYGLALAAALALIISGMLDDTRPRVVAGWIGLALVIATITWTVRGSLLGRSLFLAIAGAAAVALALVLGRLLPKEAEQ